MIQLSTVRPYFCRSHCSQAGAAEEETAAVVEEETAAATEETAAVVEEAPAAVEEARPNGSSERYAEVSSLLSLY